MPGKFERFGWLWSNKFYEETPLLGYGFIEMAKTKKEAIVWYLFIILITTAAIINIRVLHVEYLSQPTRTVYIPTTNSGSLFVPNMTLRLELPLFELTNQNPTDAYYFYYPEDLLADGEGLVELLICSMLQGNNIEYYTIDNDNPVYQLLNKYVLVDFITTVDFGAADERRVAGRPLSGKDNLRRWRELLDEKYNGLLELLLENTNKPKSMFYASWKFEQVEAVLSSALNARPTDAYAQMSILKHIRDGTNASLINSFKRTPEQVYAAAMDALNHIFHIEVKNIPEVTVSLTDWTYATQQDVNEACISFNIEISLPVGVKMVDIEIYSYYYAWMQRIWQAVLTFDRLEAREHKCYDQKYAQIVGDHQYFFHDNYIKTGTTMQMIFETSNIPYTDSTFHLDSSDAFLELIPRSTIASELSRCEEKSYQSCLKECTLDENFISCHCIPWNLYNKEITLAMCSQRCNVSLERCENKCAANSEHPCLQNNYDLKWHHNQATWQTYLGSFNSSTEDDLIETTPLRSLHIAIAKGHIHLYFIEEHDFTLATLITNSGQILEFWIGFNILALIYLTIFIVKEIGGMNAILCITKRCGFRSSNRSNTDDQESLQSLQEAYEAEIDDIRKKVYNYKSENRRRKKQRWLLENEFYQQSPVLGFNLIGAANTIVEKCFWWLALIIFSVITIWSCQETIAEFLSAPTQTSIQPTRLTHDLTVSNMTLHITLPITEFINYNFMQEPFETFVLSHNEGTVSNAFICGTAVDQNGACYLQNLMSNEIYSNWITAMHHEKQWAMLTHKEEKSNFKTPFNMNIADNKGIELNQWLKRLEMAKGRLLNFLKKNKYTPLPNKVEEKHKLIRNVNELLNGVFETRQNGTFKKLMMLDAMKTGVDPRSKMWTLFNDINIAYMLPPQGQFNKQANELWGSDSNSLLFDALVDLKDIFNIQINTAEGGSKAYLVDWNYLVGKTDDNDIYYIMDNYKYAQTFTIDIELPKNVKNVEIEINSISTIWHVYVIETVIEYAIWLSDTQLHGPTETDCPGFEGSINSFIRKNSYDRALQLMILDYGNLIVELQTGDNSMIQMMAPIDDKYHARSKHTFNASKLHGCYDGSPQECFRKCMIKTIASVCQCVPLKYFAYAELPKRLCYHPCMPENSTGHCNQECSTRTYCHLQFYDLQYKSGFANRRSIPIFGLEIDTETAHLHQKYMTEYAFGRSQLAYTILGHVELWLGLNITAAIHACLYVAKHIYRIFAMRHSKMNPMNSRTIITWINMEQQIKELQHKFSARIMKLKASKRRPQNPKYLYKLQYNSFFGETPLKGYGFIPKSKKSIELVVWYLAIISFTVLMVYNVQSALKDYISHPTQWTITPVLPSTKKMPQIENMTLTLFLSLTEFTTKNFQDSRVIQAFEKARSLTHGSLSHYIACQILDQDSWSSVAYHTVEHYWFLYFHWMDILNFKWHDKKFPTLNIDAKIEDFSNIAKLNEWKSKLAQGANDILNFLINNFNVTIDIDNMNKTEKSRDKIRELLNGPLTWSNEWLDLQLMMLHSLDYGFDPVKRLYDVWEQWLSTSDPMKDLWNIEDLSFLNPPASGETSKQQLKKLGISATDLFHIAQSELAKALHVHIPNNTGAQVFFRNWNYSATDVSADEQGIKFDLVLPANVSQLTIEIRSFSNMWQRYALEAFGRYIEHLEQHDSIAHETQNHCGSGMIREPEPNLLYYDLIDVEKYNAEVGSSGIQIPRVQLDAYGGGSLSVEGWNTTITLDQIFQVYSNAQSCDTEGKVCIDKCTSAASMDLCGCTTWGVSYLQEQSELNVCDQPCNRVDENVIKKCTDECEEKSAHPCQLNVYSITEAETVTINYDIQLDDPIFVMNIGFSERMYPQYFEEYAMSISDLLSQLGGILEFWIGANLMAFLHMFVFFARRIIKYTRSKKGAKTNKDANEEIEDFEKKIDSEMRDLIKVIHRIIEGRTKLDEKSGSINDHSSTTAKTHKSSSSKHEEIGHQPSHPQRSETRHKNGSSDSSTHQNRAKEIRSKR